MGIIYIYIYMDYVVIFERLYWDCSPTLAVQSDSCIPCPQSCARRARTQAMLHCQSWGMALARPALGIATTLGD